MKPKIAMAGRVWTTHLLLVLVSFLFISVTLNAN